MFPNLQCHLDPLTKFVMYPTQVGNNILHNYRYIKKSNQDREVQTTGYNKVIKLCIMDVGNMKIVDILICKGSTHNNSTFRIKYFH